MQKVSQTSRRASRQLLTPLRIRNELETNSNLLKLPFLRPWQNEQTLFLKHSKFACQAKRFTVWPHRKTLLARMFCLHHVKHFLFQKPFSANSACQAMFCDVTKSGKHCLISESQMFDKQCLIVWQGLKFRV